MMKQSSSSHESYSESTENYDNDEKKQQITLPQSLNEFSVDHIIHVLKVHIFNKLKPNIKEMLQKHKEQILDYIKENKLNGNELCNMKRREFVNSIKTHLNDKKAGGALGVLYKELMAYKQTNERKQQSKGHSEGGAKGMPPKRNLQSPIHHITMQKSMECDDDLSKSLNRDASVHILQKNESIIHMGNKYGHVHKMDLNKSQRFTKTDIGKFKFNDLHYHSSDSDATPKSGPNSDYRGNIITDRSQCGNFDHSLDNESKISLPSTHVRKNKLMVSKLNKAYRVLPGLDSDSESANNLILYDAISLSNNDNQSSSLQPERQLDHVLTEATRKNKVIEMNFEKDLKCIKIIGKGSFGEVWMAKWDSHVVAVKIFRDSAAKITSVNDERYKELYGEIVLAASIPPHPNIIRIFGYCRHPLCIVMEFMAGGSVRELVYDLSYKPVPSVSEKLIILIKACSGLKRLNENKLHHRDVAARNILLGEYEKVIDRDTAVKITNFGMTRKDDDSNQVQKTVNEHGPFKWMAPESIQHGVFDEKTDVYMFGITMWEIMFGQAPFRVLDAMNLAMDVVMKDDRPDLMALIKKCWDKEPDKRPNFMAIGKRLEQIMADIERNKQNYSDLKEEENDFEYEQYAYVHYIDSDYMQCTMKQHKISNCNVMKRIIHFLQTYEEQQNTDKSMSIYDYMHSLKDYNISKFLEDWHQVKINHLYKEKNFDFLKDIINDGCDGSNQCKYVQRYRRDREKDEFEAKTDDFDSRNFILMDQMDSIHSFLFHSVQRRQTFVPFGDVESDEKKQQNVLPQSLSEFSVEHIIYVLDKHIFDKLQPKMKEKLQKHREKILDYIKKNKLNGNMLCKMGRRKFKNALTKYLNDKKLTTALFALYKELMAYQQDVIISSKSKFITEEKTESNDDKKKKKEYYSFGEKYLYNPKLSNPDLYDNYVEPKYASLREELLEYYARAGTVKNPTEYINVHIEKCNVIMDMESVKGMRAARNKSNNDYGINKDDQITFDHVFALILYSQCTKLCTAFRFTYRRLKDESLTHCKKRHSLYANMGKLLFESFLFWSSTDRKVSLLYHGMNVELLFKNLECKFIAPTSTTTEESVACNFGKHGVVMKLESAGSNKYIKTIDMSLFTCFDNESEHFIFDYKLRIFDLFIFRLSGWIGKKTMNRLLLLDLLSNSVCVDDIDDQLLKGKNQSGLVEILQCIANNTISKLTKDRYVNAFIESLITQSEGIKFNMKNTKSLMKELNDVLTGKNYKDSPFEIEYQNEAISICKLKKQNKIDEHVDTI